MKIMKVVSGLTYIHGLSLALGFFDGIHLGHAVIIKNAVKYAKQNGLKTGVVLFRSHPQEFFTGEKFEHIIELNDKLNMLSRMSVDNVFLLDFDEELAKMPAVDYLENVLLKYFAPAAITTGYNHTFGAGGLGNPEMLEQYSKDFNFKYFKIPPITADNHTISSTVIRNAIKNSNFELAKSLLGYHFYIKSPVIHGRKIGRTIDFPTANLIYPQSIVNIETGVYYVYVNSGGSTYRGIMNYGLRPTIDKTDVIPVPEVHLLGYSGNLYGNVIKVYFVAKIRDEEHFGSLSELRTQIQKDCNFAKYYPFENKQKFEKKPILRPEHTKVPSPDYL